MAAMEQATQEMEPQVGLCGQHHAVCRVCVCNQVPPWWVWQVGKSRLHYLQGPRLVSWRQAKVQHTQSMQGKLYELTPWRDPFQSSCSRGPWCTVAFSLVVGQDRGGSCWRDSLGPRLNHLGHPNITRQDPTDGWERKKTRPILLDHGLLLFC